MCITSIHFNYCFLYIGKLLFVTCVIQDHDIGHITVVPVLMLDYLCESVELEFWNSQLVHELHNLLRFFML